MFRFEDIFLDSDIPTGDEPTGVLSGDDGQPEPKAAAPADDAKPAPAPAESVKASDAPGPGEGSDPSETPETLSRRQQIAADKDAKIAALEAQVKGFDRETLRAEILAEESQKSTLGQDAEQARKDAELFDRALRMPLTDPRLLELVPGTDLTLDQWRAKQINLRAEYPAAERAIRADADRVIAESRQQAQSWAEQTVAQHVRDRDETMRTQIDASTELHGVDKAAFIQDGVTWKEMAEHIHAAGAAWKEAELSERVTKAEAEADRLRKEVEGLRGNAAGDRRVPAVVGRSAGAAPSNNGFDPSQSWQENLAGAFDFGTNGSG